MTQTGSWSMTSPSQPCSLPLMAFSSPQAQATLCLSAPEHLLLSGNTFPSCASRRQSRDRHCCLCPQDSPAPFSEGAMFVLKEWKEPQSLPWLRPRQARSAGGFYTGLSLLLQGPTLSKRVQCCPEPHQSSCELTLASLLSPFPNTDYYSSQFVGSPG